MSHKRNHANVSLGGTGVQASSSSSSSGSARRPSDNDAYTKFEDSDDVMADQSQVRRTSRSADSAESDAGSDPTSRARKKAEPVKSACVQCQKRKTKCSGQRPVCRFCSDRNLECSWDIGDGLTRTADLKRKLQEANGRSDDLDELVGAMRHGSDQMSTMLLARLRLGDTLAELLTNIRLVELPGEENQPLASQIGQSGENQFRQTAAGNPSPTNPQYQFDWPQSDSPFNQMQPTGGDWKPNLTPNFYEASSQPQHQPPYFTTPDLDQSRMTWRRNDANYPTDDSSGQESGMHQQYNNPQSQKTRASQRVTLVPRGSVSDRKDRTGHTIRPGSSRKGNT